MAISLNYTATWPSRHYLQRADTSTSGFTLLEMLVVLTVIALIAGIALPNFMKMMESFTTATKWSELLVELDGLPYRAYAQGQAIRLNSENAPQVLTSLPQGWTVNVERIEKFGISTNVSGTNQDSRNKLIQYRENGWCDGGRVTFISDEGVRRTIELIAPRCGVTAS